MREPIIDTILNAANHREKDAELRDRAAEERDRVAVTDEAEHPRGNEPTPASGA